MGIHRWLVNSPHKGPVTRKMFPVDDVIMVLHCCAVIIISVDANNLPFFGVISHAMVQMHNCQIVGEVTL